MKGFLIGVVTAGILFGIAVYLRPQWMESRLDPSENAPSSAALPGLQPQREPAPHPSKAEIQAAADRHIRKIIEQHKGPSLDEMFRDEPVDQKFAADMEPKVWERVSKLPGVESVAVECHSDNCKVMVQGGKPDIMLEVRGMSYRGTQDGRMVFWYNDDLARAE